MSNPSLIEDGRPADGQAPRQIAVLIDFENCPKSFVEGASNMIESLRERGRLLVKKAFADWSLVSKSTCDALVHASFELVGLSAYRRDGKNAADIRLVIEALEIARQNQYVDTFVLVTGDSDYIPLIVKLRELGKYVIIVADEAKASRLLTGYCDEIIPLSRLVPADSAPHDAPAEYALLLRCGATLEGASILASQLKVKLLQLDPSFDQLQFGYRRFRDYLRTAAQAGFVKLEEQTNGSLLVTFAVDE